MSKYRTFIQSIIVLFSLSSLMVGCGGGGDGTIEQVDEDNVKQVDEDNVKTINSTVTIEATAADANAPLEVKFKVVSKDLILSASWNFGDGETEGPISPYSPTGPINPNSSIKHTYRVAGTYTVSVATETNSGGTQTDTIVITIGPGGIIVVPGGENSATGIWSGTFTETGFGTADLLGLMINGEAYFISNVADTVYAALYTVSNSTISANTNIYNINGGFIGTASLAGTVVAEAAINGSFETSYGSTGTITLAYDALTDKGSSLATTEGVWSLTRGTYTLTLAIDINGVITGSDTDGCIYNGGGSIIDSSINIYRVGTTVTSCGDFNGTYSGYGVVSDDRFKNDTLTYVVNNANYLLFGSLTRQ